MKKSLTIIFIFSLFTLFACQNLETNSNSNPQNNNNSSENNENENQQEDNSEYLDIVLPWKNDFKIKTLVQSHNETFNWTHEETNEEHTRVDTDTWTYSYNKNGYLTSVVSYHIGEKIVENEVTYHSESYGRDLEFEYEKNTIIQKEFSHPDSENIEKRELESTIIYTLDELNRIVKIGNEDISDGVTFTYDKNNRLLNMTAMEGNGYYPSFGPEYLRCSYTYTYRGNNMNINGIWETFDDVEVEEFLNQSEQDNITPPKIIEEASNSSYTYVHDFLFINSTHALMGWIIGGCFGYQGQTGTYSIYSEENDPEGNAYIAVDIFKFDEYHHIEMEQYNESDPSYYDNQYTFYED